MRATSSRLVVTLLIAAALACYPHYKSKLLATDDGAEAAFRVRDGTGEIVEHARVLAVTQEGVRTISKRGDLLRARIPRELLVSGRGALLICAEGYYCGGWVAGDPELLLLEDEIFPYLSITLAPVRLH